ncbi:MAG: hypothetical protein IPN53_23155 [Comamonadaceae bacterium]|nr:hypothetical protein [Comamonadaceae bacterium]
MQLKRSIIALALKQRTSCLDALPVLHLERSDCSQIGAIVRFCRIDRLHNMAA